MIKENQRILNYFNVFSDAVIIFLMLPVAFWLRFYVLPGGIISVPLSQYMVLDVVLTVVQLFTFAAFGLYHSFRGVPMIKELSRLWLACLLDMALLLSFLFIQHSVNYSRWAIAIFFLLSTGVLSCKRFALRSALRHLRKSGYNQKHVIILGSGEMARAYLGSTP